MDWLIFATVILLPALGGLALPLALRERRLHVAITALLGVELAALIVLAFNPGAARVSAPLTEWMNICFSTDAMSHLFGCLFGAIWLAVAAFSFEYMKKEHAQRRFYRYYLLTLSMMIGLCYAGNLLTFFMFFEGMTLLSLPMVLHEGNRGAVRAGLYYLGYSLFGACMVLLGMFFFARQGVGDAFTPGGLLGPDAEKGALVGVYFLMALGFAAKAGMAPLNAWLPVAHPEAPSPASAVLSGVITKCGVLGILRVTFYLFGADFVRGSWAQYVLLALAAITIFTGSMMALGEKLIKRRLAYSSVSQISYVLFGVFLLNEAGLTGALMQAVYHAVAKSALFLWAGAVIYATGRTRVDELTGLGKAMPVTMTCFAAASLSLVGIPPMAGFVSKWFLATGALEPAAGAAGVWGAVALIVSAIATAGYLLPIGAAAFFPGRDFDARALQVSEPGRLMTWPLIVLSGSLALMGVFTSPLMTLIESICRNLL